MDFCIFSLHIFTLLYKHHGSITSWGRTEKHNKDVGGVPNSYHMLWMGCDVVLDVNEPNAGFISDCELMGIRAIWEVSHYHLQPLSWKF
jgi:hypothetical protein